MRGDFLRTADGRCRRIAAVADREREWRKWAGKRALPQGAEAARSGHTWERRQAVAKGGFLSFSGNGTGQSPSRDPGQYRSGIADSQRGLTPVDCGEDRLEQRARIVVRSRVAPQPGEVGRGAQFEETRFLAAGDVDRPEETGFRPRVVRLRQRERDLAVEAMQLRKHKPLTGSFDKAEGILQRRFCAGRISRQQQDLNHHGPMKESVRRPPDRCMASIAARKVAMFSFVGSCTARAIAW